MITTFSEVRYTIITG